MNVSKQIQLDKSKDSHSSAEDDSDKESSSSSRSSENDAVSERNNSVFDDDKVMVVSAKRMNLHMLQLNQMKYWCLILI